METESVDISLEGRNACMRVETNLAALDRAIEFRENQLGNSTRPEDKKVLESAAVHRAARQSTLSLNGAQRNIRDHADSFLKTKAEAKKSDMNKHAEIDRKMDAKYTAPLEIKLAYAKQLKIGEVTTAGGVKFADLKSLETYTKEDIQVAKSCASLITEGHTKLDVPVGQAKPAGIPGAKFAAAIIDNAKDVRTGALPRNSALTPAEKTALEGQKVGNNSKAAAQQEELKQKAGISVAMREGGLKFLVPRRARRLDALGAANVLPVASSATTASNNWNAKFNSSGEVMANEKIAPAIVVPAVAPMRESKDFSVEEVLAIKRRAAKQQRLMAAGPSMAPRPPQFPEPPAA